MESCSEEEERVGDQYAVDVYNNHTETVARVSKPIPSMALPASDVFFPVKVLSVIDPVTMYITPIFPDVSNASSKDTVNDTQDTDVSSTSNFIFFSLNTFIYNNFHYTHELWCI